MLYVVNSQLPDRIFLFVRMIPNRSPKVCGFQEKVEFPTDVPRYCIAQGEFVDWPNNSVGQVRFNPKSCKDEIECTCIYCSLENKIKILIAAQPDQC